jgi:membrane protein DedA with SNARE-associated domain
MTHMLIDLMKEYSYIILYLWSILEGESGLIMAGIFSHTGDMSLFWSIVVAGLGGFTGDFIYFFIGRYNKKYVHRKLHTQRRKFALTHLLLKKYGWPIIFIQRYMYGFRTLIPISIGLTGYDIKKFAIINLVSAFVWAAITILLAWYFGEEILHLLKIMKDHWYLTLPIGGAFAIGIFYYFHKYSQPNGNKGNK